MPQIYGEREAAFLRLQRAIIQQSKDESIFAWSMGESGDEQAYTGLFGPSPSSFSDCSDIIMTPGSQGFAEENGELRITLETFPYSMETYGAILNCTRKGKPDKRFAILISKLSMVSGHIQFLRKRIFRVSTQQPLDVPINQAYGFWLRTISPPGRTECQRTTILSRSPQPSEDILYLEEGEAGTAGIIYLLPNTGSLKNRGFDEKGWSKIRWIKLGFDKEFNPQLYMANEKRQDLLGKTSIDRDKPNREILERAVSGDSLSQAHADLMNNRWMSDPAGIPSRSVGWPQGISVFKVDKKVVISGTLQALNLNISIQLVPIVSPSKFNETNDKDKGKQIWAVDLTESSSKDPELGFRDTCGYYSRGIYELVQFLAIKDDARQKTNFLFPSDLEVLS